MLSCGRIRKQILNGLTPIIDGELDNLQFTTLSLTEGQDITLHTVDREYALVLICGECTAEVEREDIYQLGPRSNPFDDPPYALFVSRENTISIRSTHNTLIGIGTAPASRKYPNSLITPNEVHTAERGADNWRRTVRMVCWSDNTQGNMLLAGETCTPSGNWSTIPPHRHQYDIDEKEASYQEVYFFQFSKKNGFGLTWQFDDNGEMDQAFSLLSGDAMYMAGGYHPVGCAPGSSLYHLSFMSGKKRISLASIHEDYQFLLDESNMKNQYTPSVH